MGSMARALLMLSATSLLAFTVTFVLGILSGLGVITFRHFLLAIPVTLLVTFTHAMTMFYLIGIGTRIKDVLTETGVTGDYRAEIRALHNDLFGPATFAILATIATFVLGGGAATRTQNPLIHGGVALVALILNGWAVFMTFDTILRTADLLDRLGQDIDELGLSGPGSEVPHVS